MEMLKRRNIRETAIQFLYFADLEGGPEASEMQETFWHLTQESSIKKLNQARAKAILHVAQGRDNRIAKLDQQAPAISSELKAVDETAPLRTALSKILTQEKKFTAAIESLRKASKANKGETVADELLDDVFNSNHSLTNLRTAWQQTLEDFPSWRNKLESITATINHLQRIAERLYSIQDPDASVGDFAHLHASSAEISIFRRETQALVQNILQNKDSIDQALASVIENYEPRRVDPVDRAILRLATYEMKHEADIPRAVSINEAIEIAKKFSTTESPRFINGVLDSLSS